MQKNVWVYAKFINAFFHIELFMNWLRYLHIFSINEVDYCAHERTLRFLVVSSCKWLSFGLLNLMACAKKINL